MSQAPIRGGQRSNTTQPFYIPTLMPMSSLQQQSVVITSSGNRVTPVISSSAFGPSQSVPVVPTVSVIQQPVPSADLYLCTTSNNATDPPAEEESGNQKKASIETLEQSYKELNSRKIKDSLSSFLPDVPGEFDSTDSSETRLRHLLDQRLIGNKEFHPLSGNALLGFRLLPGPLPEQYRIDPPVQETRTHHRKKKHKHKSLEKVGEEGFDLNPSSFKVKMPSDAFGFMKSESSLLSTQSPSHGFVAPGERALTASMQKIVSSGSHGYSTPMAASLSSGLVVGHDPMNPFPGGKKKKEKKRNKEKKKDKEKKKKKKDKHHSQDAPVGVSGPSQPTPHPPPTYSLP